MKKQIDVHNTKTLKNFQSELTKCLNALQKDIVTSVRKQQEDLTAIDNRICAFMSSKKYVCMFHVLVVIVVQRRTTILCLSAFYVVCRKIKIADG